jgi:hypothetical protein
VTLGVNKIAERPFSRKPLFIRLHPGLRLHPSDRPSEAAGVATGRRSGTVARLLVDERCSPEGERAVVEQSRERAVVEQSRCDALIREPELLNPRVGTGRPR